MNNSQQETQAFLSDVADQMDAQAAQLEANGDGHQAKPSRSFDAQFASKIVYTASYSLSYGVCFPILMACRWIPKENQFVRGLVDGSTAADEAADKALDRFHQWRLAKGARAEEAETKKECVESGVEALVPA
jgi:hypothetical protein